MNIAVLLLACILSGCRREGPERIVVLKPSEQEAATYSPDDTATADPEPADLSGGEAVIWVDEGEVLRVADEAGNIAEFGPGHYNRDDLSRDFRENQVDRSTLPEKYLAYVLQEMNKVKHEAGAHITPTVLRNLHDSADSLGRLIRPRHLEIVSGDNVVVAWKAFGEGGYRLSVAGKDGAWQQHIEVRDTFFILPASGLQDQAFYYVKLEGGGKERLFFYTREAVRGPRMGK